MRTRTGKSLLAEVNKENMQLHILEMLAVEDGRSVPGPRLLFYASLSKDDVSMLIMVLPRHKVSFRYRFGAEMNIEGTF